MTVRSFNLRHFDIKADIAKEENLRAIFDIYGIPVNKIVFHKINRIA